MRMGSNYSPETAVPTLPTVKYTYCRGAQSHGRTLHHQLTTSVLVSISKSKLSALNDESNHSPVPDPAQIRHKPQVLVTPVGINAC